MPEFSFGILARLVLIVALVSCFKLVKKDRAGFALKFDAEFLAGFQSETSGVGMTNEQIAVAVHTGTELCLPATGASP